MIWLFEISKNFIFFVKIILLISVILLKEKSTISKSSLNWRLLIYLILLFFNKKNYNLFGILINYISFMKLFEILK